MKDDWTPISYTSDTGGYRVYYSATHEGPYTFFGMTADKTVSSLTVTGLNTGGERLQGENYYRKRFVS